MIGVEFQFIYFDQSHLEEQASAHMVELSFWANKQWGLAVYGDSSTFKSEDDMGAALLYRPSLNSTHRLLYTATDFSRNQRNENKDKFAEQPASFGWVSRWWNTEKSEYLELALRADKKSHWEFPSTGVEHFYDKRYVGFKGRKAFANNRYFNGQFSLTRRNEVLSESVEFLKGEYQLQYEGLPWRKGNVLLGLQYVDRIWRQTTGEVRQKNLLPHLWWRGQAWSFGYESTIYSAKGPSALRTELDKDNFTSEHRLNVSYLFNFESSHLRWLFTFDLDRFGTGETWEGGSGQFITYF